MKKITIKEEIFSKDYPSMSDNVILNDLPTGLLPTDMIDIIRDEGYYSENNSWDSFTRLIVYREREETDEEFSLRKIKTEKQLIENKERRREQYEKLKKEFE